MSASWPQMPTFGDKNYDRSEWLLEADPIELLREHRELLGVLARVRKLAKDHQARIKRMATKQHVEVHPDQALITVHQLLQALGDKP
jgi:hypothetical protein